jgi:c-di-GMP-binding flagellar brake protein YcgR
MGRQKVILRYMDEKLIKRDIGELSLLDDFISIEDRRLHQRFTADVLDMRGKAAYAKVVQTLDISISGILLKTDERLDVGNTCILKMKRKGRVLNVKSIVTWSLLERCIKTLRGNSGSIYKAGLEFINISREKMKEIISFIENHQQDVDKQVEIFAVSGIRLHNRFQIETPEKAILICRKDYEIKNFSLGGMLIKSKDSLDIGKKLHMEISRSKDKSIKVLGKVVSCVLNKESDYAHYDIGIEFLNMLEKHREMLKEVMCLLENMGFIAV